MQTITLFYICMRKMQKWLLQMEYSMSSSGGNLLSLFCGSFMLKEGGNILTFYHNILPKNADH